MERLTHRPQLLQDMLIDASLLEIDSRALDNICDDLLIDLTDLRVRHLVSTCLSLLFCDLAVEKMRKTLVCSIATVDQSARLNARDDSKVRLLDARISQEPLDEEYPWEEGSKVQECCAAAEGSRSLIAEEGPIAGEPHSVTQPPVNM